jgi:hypothetical protein
MKFSIPLEAFVRNVLLQDDFWQIFWGITQLTLSTCSNFFPNCIKKKPVTGEIYNSVTIYSFLLWPKRMQHSLPHVVQFMEWQLLMAHFHCQFWSWYFFINSNMWSKGSHPCTQLSTTHQDIWGSGGTASHILDLGTRWRWVVSFTLQLLYPFEQEAQRSKTYNWKHKKEKHFLHLKFNWQLVSYPLYPVT